MIFNMTTTIGACDHHDKYVVDPADTAPNNCNAMYIILINFVLMIYIIQNYNFVKGRTNILSSVDNTTIAEYPSPFIPIKM